MIRYHRSAILRSNLRNQMLVFFVAQHPTNKYVFINRIFFTLAFFVGPFFCRLLLLFGASKLCKWTHWPTNKIDAGITFLCWLFADTKKKPPKFGHNRRPAITTDFFLNIIYDNYLLFLFRYRRPSASVILIIYFFIFWWSFIVYLQNISNRRFSNHSMAGRA